MSRFNLDSLESVTSNLSKGKSTPIPGLHIIANFEVQNVERLSDGMGFRRFVHALISQYGLTSVGEVFHEFDQGGFTGVVCLTESHLSIHTWPENNYLTFDIFLSNFLKDNRATTEQLYREVISYFDATVLMENFIQR